MSRGVWAIGILVLVVVGLSVSFRPAPATPPPVATFESFVDGDPLRRGAFEAGQRLATPEGGRVLVGTPGDGRVDIAGGSEADFISVEPLVIALHQGQLRARAGSDTISVQRAGRRIQLQPGAAILLRDAPPTLVVEAGRVTLDGRVVEGEIVLGSPP